ncbi:MAG: GDSL-type esterase/lipase family protein [Verrucomicrobiales bacterium]|nr:GDSL-type esterase/lipase family protein [Verrucomicrobiales bacterium]
MKRSLRRAAVFLVLVLAGPGLSVNAADDELPVIRRSFAEVNEPAPPFTGGKFEPASGETIAFLGGTDIVDLDRHLFLESAFHLAWPDRDLHLRNLALQGDTIYYQARPQNFYTRKGDPQPGSIPDHRERTRPGIIVLGFGKMDSLEGAESLPRFIAAYEKLLDELAPLTGRFVILSPTPFFQSGPAAAEAGKRNADLEPFVTALRELASARGLLFVDLFTPLRTEPDATLSPNGIHLNAAGHRVLAGLVAAQLKFPATIEAPNTLALNAAIERKNRLWQQYYRPTNWAFLFGDRQHVPASRDVEKREERWFVREIDSLPGLIAEAEADIQRYAKEAAK